MRCSSLGLVLLLCGCTVGPDYKQPAAAVINDPLAQGPFSASAAAAQLAAPPPDWWHLYNDPVLDSLVPRALASNTNIRVAQANLERTFVLIAAVKNGQQVSTAVSGTAVYAQDSAEAVLQDTPAPQQGEYGTGISVSYDLDLFGRIRRGVEAATDDSEAAEAARDLVRVNVAAETTRAYAEICDDGDQLAALQREIALQQQQVALTNLLNKNGRAVAFNVSQQQELVSNLQSELPLLKAKQINAAYRLSTLLGQPPAAYDPSWLTCQTPLRLQQPIPVGDGRSLLRRRPDVRAAERELAAATARIGVATADLYPDIRLGFSVGSTGAMASAYSAATNHFAVGPSISWDLNQGATRARIAAAKAQTRAKLAAFDGTVLNALLETQTSLKSYGAALDQLDSLKNTRNNAATVATDTQALYQGGRIDALAALAAQQKLAAANLAVADAESDVNQSQIAVFLALGGGWNVSASRRLLQ